MKEQDEVYNKSPRAEKGVEEYKSLAEKENAPADVKPSLVNVLPGELDSGDGSDEDDCSIGGDNDGWEKVSHEDLRMDGMADPFANSIKKMAGDYRELSDFAAKYDSWTLKSVIVKANDDVRQEVLAI